MANADVGYNAGGSDGWRGREIHHQQKVNDDSDILVSLDDDACLKLMNKHIMMMKSEGVKQRRFRYKTFWKSKVKNYLLT